MLVDGLIARSGVSEIAVAVAGAFIDTDSDGKAGSSCSDACFEMSLSFSFPVGVSGSVVCNSSLDCSSRASVADGRALGCTTAVAVFLQTRPFFFVADGMGSVNTSRASSDSGTSDVVFLRLIFLLNVLEESALGGDLTFGDFDGGMTTCGLELFI